MGNMEITRVSIKMAHAREGRLTRLRAFASIVLENCFEVKGLRIVEGKDGKFFVVFPNKESTRPCAKCKSKISFKDSFCKKCGTPMTSIISAVKYEDIANPVTRDFADYVEGVVLAEYDKVAGITSK